MTTEQLTGVVREWLLTGSTLSRLALADHFEELKDTDISTLLREGKSVYVVGGEEEICREHTAGKSVSDLVTVAGPFFCAEEKKAFLKGRYGASFDEADFYDDRSLAETDVRDCLSYWGVLNESADYYDEEYEEIAYG